MASTIEDNTPPAWRGGTFAQSQTPQGQNYNSGSIHYPMQTPQGQHYNSGGIPYPSQVNGGHSSSDVVYNSNNYSLHNNPGTTPAPTSFPVNNASAPSVPPTSSTYSILSGDASGKNTQESYQNSNTTTPVNRLQPNPVTTIPSEGGYYTYDATPSYSDFQNYEISEEDYMRYIWSGTTQSSGGYVNSNPYIYNNPNAPGQSGVTNNYYYGSPTSNYQPYPKQSSNPYYENNTPGDNPPPGTHDNNPNLLPPSYTPPPSQTPNLPGPPPSTLPNANTNRPFLQQLGTVVAATGGSVAAARPIYLQGQALRTNASQIAQEGVDGFNDAAARAQNFGLRVQDQFRGNQDQPLDQEEDMQLNESENIGEDLNGPTEGSTQYNAAAQQEADNTLSALDNDEKVPMEADEEQGLLGADEEGIMQGVSEAGTEVAAEAGAEVGAEVGTEVAAEVGTDVAVGILGEAAVDVATTAIAATGVGLIALAIGAVGLGIFEGGRAEHWW